MNAPAESVISLGSLCLTATLLQSMGLKTESYPFDWIFSYPAMVAHCLDDNFATLLDQSQYVPVQDSDNRQAYHQFYNRNPESVAPVFNHRNPATEGDYQYLQRCVARFREKVSSPSTLFVLIRESSAEDALEFAAVATAMRRRSQHAAMRHLVYHPDMAHAGTVLVRQEIGRCALVEVRTRTLVTYGTRFVDPADDELFRMVIKDAAATG